MPIECSTGILENASIAKTTRLEILQIINEKVTIAASPRLSRILLKKSA
jgi:hypothetical protein